MDEANYQDQQSYDGQLSNNEMMGIYQALSVKENDEFDTAEELQYIQECIGELYDEKFLVIDKTLLERDALLLNNKIVELIKYCKQKNNYKKIGYLFIGFCYYFDLDEVLVYKNLHEKIQALIKHSTMQICGKKHYKSIEYKNREHKDIQVISLFSLARK